MRNVLHEQNLLGILRRLHVVAALAVGGREVADHVVVAAVARPGSREVDLLHAEMGVAEAELHGEGGALARTALDRDFAVVQGHDVAAQRKPDARPLHVAVHGARSLREAFEDHPLLVFRDADARVADREKHALLLFAQRKYRFDPSAVGREFQSVGQQIIDHALHALDIDPHQHGTARDGEQQFDPALGGQFAEIVDGILDQRHEVHARDFQLHLVLDDLAEIKQLVDERQHALGVAVGQREAALAAGRKLVVFPCILDAAQNERQRRAQFMGDVGEEAQLQVGHVLLDARLAADADDRTGDAEGHGGDGQRQQHVERLGPPGEPRGGGSTSTPIVIPSPAASALPTKALTWSV